MKKFICKAVLFGILVVLIIAPINIYFDPYNVFHYEEPVNNGVEPNKNFIKTKYILKNPDKFDSFLFGSSRAGFVDTAKLTGGKYYNMSSSEAVPAEHLRTLKVFLRKGIVPKNIMILMDDISCFVDPAMHDEVLYRIPYPVTGILSHMKFYLKYVDVLTTLDALSVIKEHKKTGEADENYVNRYQTTGTERLDKGTYFDGMDLPAFWADYYSLRTGEVIEDIKEIKRLCDENGINLTFVINPLYHKTYLKAAENGYLSFLEELAEVTDFYNFSGLNDITTIDACFYEPSHFVSAVGDMMIHYMQEGAADEKLLGQGFGMHVTKENKEEYLRILEAQIREVKGRLSD